MPLTRRDFLKGLLAAAACPSALIAAEPVAQIAESISPPNFDLDFPSRWSAPAGFNRGSGVLNGDFTVSAWLRPPAGGSIQLCVLSRKDADASYFIDCAQVTKEVWDLKTGGLDVRYENSQVSIDFDRPPCQMLDFCARYSTDTSVSLLQAAHREPAPAFARNVNVLHTEYFVKRAEAVASKTKSPLLSDLLFRISQPS